MEFTARAFHIVLLLCLGLNAAADTPVLPPRPLSLTETLALVRQRNPDLQAAQARIWQAAARLDEVNAAFLPRIKAGVHYLHSNDPARAFGMIVSQRRFDFSMDVNHPGYVEDFRPEIGAYWSLFRGGQDWYARQAAKLGIDSRRLQRSELHNLLAAAASRAFYALLEAPKRVEVADKTLTTVRKELELMRARQREGTALKSDVLSLEVRLAQARHDRIRAENAEQAARTALATLLALPSDARLQVRDESRRLPSSEGKFESWLRQALAHRPEWLAARKQVAMREKALKAAWGGHLPRVDAFVVYGMNSRNPRFPTSRDNWTMGLKAEIDLFSGGAVNARVRQARRRLEEAERLAESTRLRVEKEVRSAWLDLRDALARVEVARRGLAAAEEALKLVRAQYRGGTATVTRFLEAETDAAGARLQLISARFGALVAEAELKRATGMWSLEEPR
ncbi:outer membrane protein [Methylomarinovum caldicuralii]|uniref:Protein CyaE n=1 Tax=Methylomarinovum caldicuralii TaxID=438856 RepID=A0AAU9C384_9GAMM|nr:TolC family protein [Methylomarinovum caldicuralii]BCX81660.1 outer membrane protein [Methylomarinovum caldicuralii]